MGKIVFDGRLRYVCPHCGAEQRFIGIRWVAHGSSETGFSLLLRKDTGERPFFEIDLRYEDIGASGCRGKEVKRMFCPGCRKRLGGEDVWEGLWKWLERLRTRDPELYARIINEML